MPLPQDTAEFVRRWRDKRTSYGDDRLEDVFDRFFTSYVLYNFLYEWVALRERYTFNGDQKLAVKVVRRFLGSNELFSDAILQRAVGTITSLIRRRTFYIRDTVWDSQRIMKLQTNDPEQWSKGFLEVIYAIRCNTFHGQKRFEEEQRLILKPCIEALERLNDLLINRLEA
jgi:hypothetical protein